MKNQPKGPQASRLRQRKYEQLRGLNIPVDGLPGSLSITWGRCGKSTCHCREGEGHPSWTLTFMVDGKKRVERIPREWVEEVRRQVEAGRKFKEAVANIFAMNTQLLVIKRQQRKQRNR